MKETYSGTYISYSLAGLISSNVFFLKIIYKRTESLVAKAVNLWLSLFLLAT